MRTGVRISIGALLAALWLGCGGGAGQTSSGDVDPVSELDLGGQTEADVRASYGPPQRETSFSVYPGVALPELQSGLYDAVVAGLAEGDSARVQEWRWEGARNRAVWFVERDGRWVVADAIEWDRDVQF